MKFHSSICALNGSQYTLEKSDNMSINAAELAEKILSHPKGGVEALINLTHKQETEWIEFKASLTPHSENYKKKGENLDDYKWHVAKAIVALVNTRGGVVIIGVDDNGNSVGIEHIDSPSSKQLQNVVKIPWFDFFTWVSYRTN